MLRKKLSKLIVSIMTVAVISGGMGVGQTAFASSNTEVVVTQNSRVAVTDETTMLNALNDPTNANVELKLEVTTSINLTDAVINAINIRTAPLTIEFGGMGNLVIDATTSAVILDGTNSSLKMVRGTGKTDEMLVVNNQQAVTIRNVNFENGDVESQSAIRRGTQAAQGSVTLESNHLQGKGALLNQNGGLTGVTFSKNILNQGKLLSNQTLDFGLTSTSGTTVINFYGDVVNINGTSVNVKSGTATIRVIDPTTSLQVKEVPNITMNVTSDPTSGVFNSATFTAFADGLEVNKQYDVELVIEVIDGSNNEYVRTQRYTAATQGNFSSTAVNVTNNSATININHGSLPTTDPTKYPLKINVTGGTVNAIPEISTTTTSVNLTGLTPNTTYTYQIVDKSNSIISTGTFKTTSSTISGNTGSGSVTTGDLTSSDINKADIKDVSASIPVGNTTLLNSLKNGKDYKTNIEGVSVTFTNDKLEVSGLVPGQEYKNLTITYTDKDGRTRTVKVPTFKTKESETKLRQFIVDVYKYSLGRTPDERGFAYWEDQLKNKKTSPADFVKNLLNENEFINKHKTTTEKIEALYQVIVNRSSDSQGLSYWTTKYDDLVKKGYSESMALRMVVDEMVNEQEFKNRVQNLGL